VKESGRNTEYKVRVYVCLRSLDEFADMSGAVKKAHFLGYNIGDQKQRALVPHPYGVSKRDIRPVGSGAPGCTRRVSGRLMRRWKSGRLRPT
jgi:hypothetical protein